MIELKDLYEALSQNEKAIGDLQAENRAFLKLIDIENSKNFEQPCEEMAQEEVVQQDESY
jgi:hypothetical protein